MNNKSELPDTKGSGLTHVLDNDELRVLGKISRLFLHGKQIYPVIKSVETEPTVPKKKNKQYIIIPIKDKDSVVEFIKVPVFKAEKKIKAKAKECIAVPKLCPGANEPATTKMILWSANKEELSLGEKGPSTSKKSKVPETSKAAVPFNEEPSDKVSKGGRKESVPSRFYEETLVIDKLESVEYVFKRESKCKDETTGGSQDAGSVKQSKSKRKTSKATVPKEKKKLKQKRKKSQKDDE